MLSFYILECIIVVLVNIHMILLDILSSLISCLIESNSICILFKFQSIVSFIHCVHLVFLLIMHILYEILSSLHIFNSFLGFFLFFSQLNNTSFYHDLFVLDFLMLQMSLHHLSVSCLSQWAHSTGQIFPLLPTLINWTLFRCCQYRRVIFLWCSYLHHLISTLIHILCSNICI